MHIADNLYYCVMINETRAVMPHSVWCGLSTGW